ncbi:hypothetical protein OSTOST_23280 [Ostertagia ostertagi]
MAKDFVTIQMLFVLTALSFFLLTAGVGSAFFSKDIRDTTELANTDNQPSRFRELLERSENTLLTRNLDATAGTI